MDKIELDFFMYGKIIDSWTPAKAKIQRVYKEQRKSTNGNMIEYDRIKEYTQKKDKFRYKIKEIEVCSSFYSRTFGYGYDYLEAR